MAEKRKTKRSHGEQSDSCDLEQVIVKPQFQANHHLTIRLQTWYHSLLWGVSIRKGVELEKQNCLLGVHIAELGKKTFFFFKIT